MTTVRIFINGILSETKQVKRARDLKNRKGYLKNIGNDFFFCRHDCCLSVEARLAQAA